MAPIYRVEVSKVIDGSRQGVEKAVAAAGAR